MAYNPFAKLDELKYAASVGSTTPTSSYNPSYSLYSSKTNTTTKPSNINTYGGVGSSPYGPTYTKPTTTPTNNTSTPSYLGSYQTLVDKQKQQAADALAKSQANTSASYAERNRLLQESIPRLQQQFADTQGFYDKANLAAQQKAEAAKQNIETEAGSTQRQNAETLRTGQANIAQRFANLGTSDSYGYGSHMQAQENVQSDFNRLTAENLRQKQAQKAEIDTSLQEYELQAQQKLLSLKGDLDNTIAQIQSNINMNDIEKQNALDSVLADYNNQINSLDSEMNGVYKDYQLKLMELEKTGLSQEFMQTGVPQNENDYKFLVENSDKYDKYGKIIGGKNASTNDPETIKAIDMIDTILNGNSNAISGSWRPGNNGITRWIFGGGNESTAYQGLQDLLTVAKRKMMTGQGQISDFESKMLQSAALAGIDPTKQTEEEFRSRLNQLRGELIGDNNQGNVNADDYDKLLSQWGY